MKNLDELCVNTLRFLAVDAVEQAHSGHPGLPLGAAPMAYVLWDRFLRHNPRNPFWINRDRFILSAGHGSALLYALLHLYGYDLPLEELKWFRQWGSKTPGHPEYGLTPGVEATTGPLGQGFAMGVGIAFSILLESTPLKPSKRQKVIRIVSEVLQAISELKAARCCQRESLIALREAARLSEEHLDIKLIVNKDFKCNQYEKNKECIKAACPFWMEND